jgi:hypothetical protein
VYKTKYQKRRAISVKQIINQQNTISNGSVGTIDAWQSFTPNFSPKSKGILTKVGFEFSSNSASVINVGIRAGEGVIGTTQIGLESITNAGSGWNEVEFSPGIVLTSGSKYTIHLARAVSSGTFYWKRQSTDVYPGGRFVIFGQDGTFKVWSLELE